MFLLVPAHPGCPGQNPESRKMAVHVFTLYLRTAMDKLGRMHIYMYVKNLKGAMLLREVQAG